MLDFGENNLLHEDENLFPAVNPTIMEGVEIPLPPEIGRLAEAFKLDTLKDIQHEIVSPGTPNRRKVGRKVADMSFKSRQDLKKRGVLQVTGRKLYVTGGAIRDWLINHFHGIAHPQDDWDLATDASPESLRLIIKSAIEEGELPEDTTVSNTDKKFGNIHLTISGKTFEVTTFPFAGTADAPRMYLDSLRRNFSPNALYYSIDEKKIYDYHSGITDIFRRTPNFVGKARKRMRDDEAPLYPLVYARLHARMNSKGADNMDKDAKNEISKFVLPYNIDRSKVHDEVHKGIKQALDKSKYFKILHELGLLKQIFPSLRVDPDAYFGDMILFPQIIAQVLKPNWNNLGHVAEILRNLEFHQREIHDIIFLMKLPHYTDEQTLKGERIHTGLSERSIEQFIKVTNPKNGEWIRSVIKNGKKPLNQPVPQQAQQNLPPVLQVAHYIVESRKNDQAVRHFRF
jgi:tRNA nucleotidyltransferase/poly(A) polymerase